MGFERHYKDQYNKNMMGDYIWALMKESAHEHRGKNNTVHF